MRGLNCNFGRELWQLKDYYANQKQALLATEVERRENYRETWILLPKERG